MKEAQMKSPTNTTRQAKEMPILPLVESLGAGGTSGMIERQEARGQRELVQSDTLPTEMDKHGKHNARKILEAAGVVFGELVDGDPMFQYVTLPEGWKKEGTDHSMWSKLVDEKGRERAAIFYKAAFYDRSTHLRLSTRYSVQPDYDREETEKVVLAHALDGKGRIFSSEAVSTAGKRSYGEMDEARDEAEAWLTKQFPEWKNPGAYWD